MLVAAPTGAGKTIVGEFAVFLALQQGRKCFYTTPIKALSNQKYADLVRRHGPGQVGLLTGDSSINSEAPVVVMTTEVLRNMIYAGSRDPGQPRLRGDGRGALPGRPVPRRGLGGGDHRAGRVDPGGRPVGDGEQRRGVRRVAGRGPRRDGRRGLRAATGAAVPARAGRPALYDLFADVAPTARESAARRQRPRSTRRWSRSPGTSPATSATTPAGRGAAAAGASARSATAAARTAARRTGRAPTAPGRPAALAARRRPAGPGRAAGRGRRCCRRSCSSSPGSAATPRCGQLLGSGMRLTSPAEQRRDRRDRRAARRRAVRRRPAGAGLRPVRRGADPRDRGPPRRACCPPSRSASRRPSSAA